MIPLLPRLDQPPAEAPRGFVIASRGGFWGPDRAGYTDLLRAGLYTEAEARAQERSRPGIDRALSLDQAIADVYGDRPFNLTVLVALLRRCSR